MDFRQRKIGFGKKNYEVEENDAETIALLTKHERLITGLKENKAF